MRRDKPETAGTTALQLGAFASFLVSCSDPVTLQEAGHLMRVVDAVRSL
jgi:hypothetical protein